MPQASYAYAVARAKALQMRVLSKEKINRLLETTHVEDTIRLLQESGFGAHVHLSSPIDYETLLQAEWLGLNAFVHEVAPCPTCFTLFLLQQDIHNLKVLYKARALGISAEGLLWEHGSISLSHVQNAVQEGQTNFLPTWLKEACHEIENMLAVQIDPQAIDLILDKALFAEIFRVLEKVPPKADIFLGYFKAQAELINVTSILRVIRAGADENLLRKVWLPFGDISLQKALQVLMANADEGKDRVLSLCKGADFGNAIIGGLESFFATQNMLLLEKNVNAYLFSLVAEKRNECFSPEPILYYYLMKKTEISSVRQICVGIQNGVDAQVIRERIGEMYV